jgi:membrane-associated phospholipid phosphatase
VLLLLSALLMALFKQLLFTGFDRPIRALGPQAVHYVAGHEPLHKSFPSGHTLTAFVCTAVAASGFANRWIQAGFALLAVLLGYTRIYLGVHFVADVLVAAGLGTLLAYGGLRYVEPRAMQWLARWLNADTARRNLQLVLAAACSLSLAVGAYVRFWGGFYD